MGTQRSKFDRLLDNHQNVSFIVLKNKLIILYLNLCLRLTGLEIKEKWQTFSKICYSLNN